MANPILDRCKDLGIDGPRLKKTLNSHDNWGGMVHAFEYLAVLGIVADAFEAEKIEEQSR